MVEIECPEEPTWKSITIQPTNAKIIELRLVSRKGSTGDRYNIPGVSEARCIAHLLLAAAEHPTEAKMPREMPLIARRAASDRVELRLWGSPPKPFASLFPSTARRVAYGLLGEVIALDARAAVKLRS